MFDDDKREFGIIDWYNANFVPTLFFWGGLCQEFLTQLIKEHN